MIYYLNFKKQALEDIRKIKQNFRRIRNSSL